MPKHVSADTAVAALANLPEGRSRVYMPGAAGESALFTAALRTRPELAAGLTFFGVWLPGINRIDYSALHAQARGELFFLSADFHESFHAGRALFRPMTYSAIYPWLERTPVDAALLQVSPPGADGQCSLGVAPDFSGAVMNRAGLRIGHINPAMPDTAGAPRIAFDQIDLVVEDESPLLSHQAVSLPPVFERIAGNVATLVDDGDTVQVGIGKLQLMVLRTLTSRRTLRVHSGMVTESVLALMDSDALSGEEGAVTIGAAIGGAEFYRRLAADPRVRFASVRHTHDGTVLREINNFTAINSVIEVDLYGQANAEFMNGRQISGPGGLVDFLRGARYAPGGKPIVALASTAEAGTVSRIVPRLGPDTPPTVARGDIGFVVTEHGVADLRTLDVDARAEALIAIADPAHRGTLEDAWRDMRQGM